MTIVHSVIILKGSVGSTPEQRVLNYSYSMHHLVEYFYVASTVYLVQLVNPVSLVLLYLLSAVKVYKVYIT